MGKTSLIVRPSPSSRSRAIVQFDTLRLPAAIGRTGRRAVKREGDGATPIAAMTLLSGFFRAEHRKALPSRLPLRAIRRDMLWCDEPKNANYNRLVRMPLGASHERLQREDSLYDICLVMDWNITSRARNRGSAIFFHLIHPGYAPTAGCVAVSRRDMVRILPFLKPGMTVRVV